MIIHLLGKGHIGWYIDPLFAKERKSALKRPQTAKGTRHLTMTLLTCKLGSDIHVRVRVQHVSIPLLGLRTCFDMFLREVEPTQAPSLVDVEARHSDGVAMSSEEEEEEDVVIVEETQDEGQQLHGNDVDQDMY